MKGITKESNIRRCEMVFEIERRKLERVLASLVNTVPFTLQYAKKWKKEIEEIKSHCDEDEEWGWDGDDVSVRENKVSIVYYNYADKDNPSFEGLYDIDTGILMEGIYTTGESGREIVLRRINYGEKYQVELPWWEDSVVFRLQWIEALLREGVLQMYDDKDIVRRVVADYILEYGVEAGKSVCEGIEGIINRKPFGKRYLNLISEKVVGSDEMKEEKP